MLVETEQLKDWLYWDGISRTDRLLLILASFDEPRKPQQIRLRAANAGFKIPKSWNITDCFAESKGLAVPIPRKGWELSPGGKKHVSNLKKRLLNSADPRLSNLDDSAIASPLKKDADNLESLLQKMNDPFARSLLKTAIDCYRHRLHKPAILTSWVAAIYVLRLRVLANYPENFDEEAKSLRRKWEPAESVDDFDNLPDADFINTLYAVGILTKGVSNKLHHCRQDRNACGHPDKVDLDDDDMVKAHIKALYRNVFTKFPC
ncbi:MAG: hypothetical protein MJE68_26210 [Proteobacteria bacterium]|nr:hypothetical protein [Pseudomonadota bacterium]